MLGLGNTILTDDGVGILVVRDVAGQCQQDNVEFEETSVGGLRLLDVIGGYGRIILVDAIQTGDGIPGTIHRLHPSDFRSSLHAGSSHDLSLAGALRLGRDLGMILPEDESFLILAVEVENVLDFGESCTPAVQAAIPRAAAAVLAELSEGASAGVD